MILKIINYFKRFLKKLKDKMYGIEVINEAGITIETSNEVATMGIESSGNIEPKQRIEVGNVNTGNVNKVILSSSIGYSTNGAVRNGIICSYETDSSVFKMYNYGESTASYVTINSASTKTPENYGVSFGEGFGAIEDGYKALHLIYSGRGTIENSKHVRPSGDEQITRVIRVSVLSNTPPIIFSRLKDVNGGEDRYVCTPLGKNTSGNRHDFYFFIRSATGGGNTFTAYSEGSLLQHFYVFSSDTKHSSSEYGLEIFNPSGALVYSGDYITASIYGRSIVPFIQNSEYRFTGEVSNHAITSPFGRSEGKILAVNIAGGCRASFPAGGSNFARSVAPAYHLNNDNTLRQSWYTIGTIGQTGSNGSLGSQYAAAMMKDYTDSGYSTIDTFASFIDATRLPEYFGENHPRLIDQSISTGM